MSISQLFSLFLAISVVAAQRLNHQPQQQDVRIINPSNQHAATWKLLEAEVTVGGTGPHILPEINVQEFGAKADGSDDTEAFQAALATAQQGGNAIVNVPAGTYSIQGHLVVPPHTTLKGVNTGPYSQEGTLTSIAGTTLQAFEGANCWDCDKADPFILLHGPNAAITSMSIVYPEQNNSTAIEPISYPWCIRGHGDNVLIQNMFLVNPYLGIDLGTLDAGRHLVDNVYGNPLKIGIFVDQTYDVGRIRHIHFWNFWAGRIQPNGPVTNLQKWVSANGITLKLARTDWEIVQDVFSWGYGTGALLVESTVIDPTTKKSVGAMNGQFTDIQFDAVNVGVDIVKTNPYGVFFSNLNLANAGWGDKRIGILARPESKGANVVVRGASFWGSWYQAVQWDSQAFFTISDSTVVEWDNKSSRPLMNFSAGSIGVRGCTFGGNQGNVAGGVAMEAGPNVERLIVTGNDLLGMTIQSQAPHAIIDNNLA